MLLQMAEYYASIHKFLREDPILLKLMGIEYPAAFTDEGFLSLASVRIQKRKKPQSLNIENMPLISFYNNPGFHGANPLEYLFSFNFDIYSNDDVEWALLISDHITKKFEEQDAGLRCCLLKGQWMAGGECETDQLNTYKYFTQILFTLILNK